MIMKKPEIEVIRFECSDIVAASITLFGLGNDKSSDNGFAFGSYNLVGASAREIRTSMADYFDARFSDVENTEVLFKNGTKTARLPNLATGKNLDEWNGTYEYVPDTVTFTKKS